MSLEASLIAAFIMGFSGGVHCLVMCGGIGSALAVAAKSPYYLGLYQFGRITSYVVVALVFASLLNISTPGGHSTMALMQGLSAILLLAIGLHLGFRWNSLRLIEAGGALFWARIRPYTQKLFPVDSGIKAFAFGLVWGWLPCGLVYSALAWSLSQGSILTTAACMFSFGLGTLPWLLASSGLAKSLASLPLLRPALGVILIGLALWSFYCLTLPFFSGDMAVENSEHLHHH